MVINNKLIINYGKGKFTQGSKDQETSFSITFPKAYTKSVCAVINADVGSSGWQYLNGIAATSSTLTKLQGRYSLGAVSATSYNWIAIGY